MKMLPLLIWKELCGRKASFLLTAGAIAAAVALCTGLYLTNEASRRETKRLTRDLGFNMRIIPRSTDMEQFYLKGYSDQAFSEDSLDRLAAVENLSYNHLIAVLQGKVEADGREVLVMGISNEQSPPGRKKPPMIKAIERGSVHVGSEIAKQLKLNKGDQLELKGQQFLVARKMPEMGSIDDLRIVGALEDVQAILAQEGLINEIQALDCLCMTPAEDPRAILQAEIEKTLPDVRVVMLSNIAESRARQRRTSDRNAQFIMVAVLLVASAWVCFMTVVNVRERSSELGAIRALGYGSGSILILILGRAAILGVIGALIGALLGTWGGLEFGPRIFQVTARAIQPKPELFWYALLATPIFAGVASLVPAILAIVQDPAQVLRSE